MDIECYFDKINKKIDEMSDSEFIDLLNKSGLEKCPYLENVELEDSQYVRAIQLGVGSKIEINGKTLKALEENKYVKENFKLNILKLSEEWYSVYFDDINKYK